MVKPSFSSKSIGYGLEENGKPGFTRPLHNDNGEDRTR
jgi:hypothetical protein